MPLGPARQLTLASQIHPFSLLSNAILGRHYAGSPSKAPKPSYDMAAAALGTLMLDSCHPPTGFSAGPLSIGTQMVTGRRGLQRLVATSKARAYPLLPGGQGAADLVST
jgi:hypothetical protein